MLFIRDTQYNPPVALQGAGGHGRQGLGWEDCTGRTGPLWSSHPWAGGLIVISEPAEGGLSQEGQAAPCPSPPASLTFPSFLSTSPWEPGGAREAPTSFFSFQAEQKT